MKWIGLIAITLISIGMGLAIGKVAAALICMGIGLAMWSYLVWLSSMDL